VDVLSFRWRAKYGHFLRAEAISNALTYPVPPRTAVLGLLGAVVGLPKDALASELASVLVSVAGPVPVRFWHRVKLRKDPPAALPRELRLPSRSAKTKTKTAAEKATLLRQEWLLGPDFVVRVAMPEDPGRFAELAARVEARRWHFTPCMGLSEMLADVEPLGVASARPLPPGRVRVEGCCLASGLTLRAEPELGVQLLRLPRRVSADRIFVHDSYYLEHRGRSFTVETDAAWRVGEHAVVFS